MPRRKPLSLVTDGHGYFEIADRPHAEASTLAQAATCALDAVQRQPGRAVATAALIAEVVRLTGIRPRSVERALRGLRKNPRVEYMRGKYTFRPAADPGVLHPAGTPCAAAVIVVGNAIPGGK
jgi:hypothetical protein